MPTRSKDCPGAETFETRRGTRGGHTAIACPRACRVCKSEGHSVVDCPKAGSDPAGKRWGVAPWIRNLVRNRASQGRGDEVGRGQVLGEGAASGGAGEKTSYGHEGTEWWKTCTALEKRRWKRRKYSGRDAIRHREVHARKPISQRIQLLSTHVGSGGLLEKWGLRRAATCGRCGGRAATAPGGLRARCGKRTCRAWVSRDVPEVRLPKLKDDAIAALIWCWAYGLTTDLAACAVGVSYSAATHAFQRFSLAAALEAWEAQKGLILGGTVELDETSARTQRVGSSTRVTSSDGMATTFVGPGHMYVRYCGAMSRGTRDFVLYEMPDALTAVSHDGKPGPPAQISLAELRAMRMESHVAKDATCMADSAEAYRVEFEDSHQRRFFDVNHQAAEWTRVDKKEKVVCGTQAIDRLWRTIKDGIARTAHTTDREHIRIAVYAQAWRYRFIPGGNEPGDPYLLAGEMLQRFAAKRARGESDVFAARFADYADLDVYALPHTDRERRGVFPQQRLNLPVKSAGGVAAVRPRRLRRKILPGREIRKQRELRATQAARVAEAATDVAALDAAADARLAITRRAAVRREQTRSAVTGAKCPAGGCPFRGDSVATTRRHWQRAHAPWAPETGVFRCDHPVCEAVPPFNSWIALRKHVGQTHPERSVQLGLKYVGPKAVREAAERARDMDPAELPSARTLVGHPVWLRVVERRAAGLHAVKEGNVECPDKCGAKPFSNSKALRRHWEQTHFRPGAAAPLTRTLRVSLERRWAELAYRDVLNDRQAMKRDPTGWPATHYVGGSWAKEKELLPAPPTWSERKRQMDAGLPDPAKKRARMGPWKPDSGGEPGGEPQAPREAPAPPPTAPDPRPKRKTAARAETGADGPGGGAPGDAQPLARHVGLPNPKGVVCYLNASTQSLIHGTQGGFEALARYAAREAPDRPVVRALNEALAGLREAGHVAENAARGEASDGPFCVFADAFAQHGNFEADRQQDAAEAYGKLLGLFDDASAPTSTVGLAARRHFGIRFQNYVVPIVGGEAVEDLQRSLGGAETDFLVRARMPSGSLRGALRDLFVERSQTEFRFGGSDSPNVPVLMGCRLRDLPTFLVIQVCRFAEQAWPRGGQPIGGPLPAVAKDHRKFEFPLGDLRMDPYVEGRRGGTEYELRAAVVHKGENGAAGHYVAFARSEQGWRRYDDRRVTRATPADVEAEGFGGGKGRNRWSSACVLTYARRGAAWPDLG